MNLLRPASPDDFTTIYNLQNIPHRQKIFIDPLPPFENFLRKVQDHCKAGEQVYYMFEQNGIPNGWIEFQCAEQTGSFWGKWLNTLVYASMVLAFEDLKFSRLVWYTRASNVPMLRVCEKMKFRRTGERQICNISPQFSFIAIGKIFLFEVTAEEFQNARHGMKELSLPVKFQFRSRPLDAPQAHVVE